eukprot:COSAG02_NODE_82_length_39723_cov_247.146650_41_plen_280_part_00
MEVALRKQITDLQERNKALEAGLRAANDEISRLRGRDGVAARTATPARQIDTSMKADTSASDAAAWVSSQLQLHDREQASQKLLLTICELLQVPEPAQIVPALSSVVRAVRKLPQMDSFIGKVAETVLETSSRAELHSRRLQDVVPTLQRWKAERANGSIEELRDFKDSVAQTLVLARPPAGDELEGWADGHMQRSVCPRDQKDHCRLMVSQIARLVQDQAESERRFLSRQGVYRQAEALMDPKELPSRMVRHFQQYDLNTAALQILRASRNFCSWWTV